MRLLHAPRSVRLRRWLSVLVVLVFGFKALIPTGYMLAAVDGHAQLVICPSSISVTAAMHSVPDMAHMAGMQHAAHAANQCPFALAGGAAFRATLADLAEPNFVILQPPREFAPASVPSTPPSRFRAPRGPPSLA